MGFCCKLTDSNCPSVHTQLAGEEPAEQAPHALGSSDEVKYLFTFGNAAHQYANAHAAKELRLNYGVLEGDEGENDDGDTWQVVRDGVRPRPTPAPAPPLPGSPRNPYSPLPVDDMDDRLSISTSHSVQGVFVLFHAHFERVRARGQSHAIASVNSPSAQHSLS